MAGKRYAILIAASKFPEEPGLTELRCPENDVDALKELLISPDCGLFGKKNIFVFKNRHSYEILPKLNSILHTAEKDDLVLVYYSGHGKTNLLGHLCLTTHNTIVSALEATSIPAATIKSYFDLSATRKRILILDCCDSGAVEKAFVTKGDLYSELQNMSGQGTFIMTASTSIQPALEKKGDQYSLFTKHLLEGIRSGEADADEDGLISLDELYKYVNEKVQAESAQVPMAWDLQKTGGMIIAKSGREAKKKWRQKLRAMLYKQAAQDLLSDGIVSAAVHVIFLPDKEMTAKDRECLLLIEQLADKRISLGNFVECWMKTCLADKQEGDKDTPSSTKNLWNWLLHDVFFDLLSRFILAAFIFVMGWWSLKQSESRPEIKQTPSEPPVAQAISKLPSIPIIMPKMAVVSVRRQAVPSLSSSALSPLPTLPPPPAMDTISVSRQAVPALSQTKLQPLSKAEKMSQTGTTIGRYIDHGDGTVTDTKTGLMWKRCSEGLEGVNCGKGKVERYNYYDAVKRFKNIEYAGYKDWRLPTVDELKTLVYCSKGADKDDWCNEGSAKPTINQQAFPNTLSNWYWSGSPNAYTSASLAWYVFFDYGYSVILNRNNLGAVRLVRGGQ